MNANIQIYLSEYLNETLGINIHVSEWDGYRTLPYAIRSAYTFAQMRILGREFLVFYHEQEEGFSAVTISKHLSWLENRTGLRAVFVAEVLESFNRKRLIEQKISFIIPGNQLYIPDLGLDLREQLKRIREKRKRMSPSAQLLLLTYLLRNSDYKVWTATGLSETLSLTKMTMGRAIDELVAFQLIEVESEWREKRIQFRDDKRELWEAALPLMQSPVHSQVYLQDDPFINSDFKNLPRDAGHTTLAEMSMLVPPTPPVKAISRKKWKVLQENPTLQIIPKPSRDLAAVELEIWKYDPRKLTQNQQVDPLSLYLSLQHETNERVEEAIEHMMNRIKW